MDVDSATSVGQTAPLFETVAATRQSEVQIPEQRKSVAEIVAQIALAAEQSHIELESPVAVEPAFPADVIEQQYAKIQPMPVRQAAQNEPAPTPAAEPVIRSMLEQIETDPSKHALIEVTPAETAPPAPRRRTHPREIYSVANSEPLVQIETHHPSS
jgi:hypothetical protein